jgi:TonB family protein
MNLLRVSLNNLLKSLSGWTNDFYIAFSVSVLIHLFILYCVFFIPSSKPLNMESITVDFAAIKFEEFSDKVNTKGRGQGVRGREDKKTPEMHGEKEINNKISRLNNPAWDKQSAAKNTADTEEKNNSVTPIHSISMNALSNHNDYDSQAGAGTKRGGKTGGSSYGSTEGKGQGSSDLSGETGGGRTYDYGYVRDTIMKHLKYPEKARRFGWEGKVVLYFVINETGSVQDVKIVKSSGIQSLDEAAKDALAKVAAFRNKYNRLVVVQLPIEFRLKQ